MKAIILAGGFGSGLGSVAKDFPKPMILVAGKPLLEHQIIFLRENGITDLIIAVHHMSDIIKSYFGDGNRFGINITYSEEDIPLGTAGAIKNAERYIDDTFLVLNGDCYSRIDLKDFLEFHKNKRSKCTIAVTKSKNKEKYGNVLLDNDKVIEFLEKENEKNEINNLEYFVNVGVYLFEPIIFDYIEPKRNISLEKDIFQKLMNENILRGYLYDGYFIDVEDSKAYNQLKRDILRNEIFISSKSSIKEAMQKISKSNIDLLLVVDENEKLLGVLNDRIIRNFLFSGGNVNSNVSQAMIKDPSRVARINDSKDKIYNLLLGVRHLPILDENNRVVDVEFRVEKIKQEIFPVIRGRSPLRISFAGGGTDLPEFFEKFGGVVVNCTIDKYIYGTLIKRADSKIIINSDIAPEIIIDSKNELRYDGKYDLIKAIINILKPDFGFELYLYNDVPPGRGLGSSASLAVLVVKLITTIQGLSYDDYKIAEIAHKAETQELKIKGGWQDQYASVTGGFSFMEFDNDKTIIYPLRLKEEVINDLNHYLLLCYVGKTHFSGEHQESLGKSCEESETDVINSLKELKKIAIEIKNSLLTNNLENIGRLLHISWENKKKCGKRITNPNIDKLYNIAIENGAYGGKLLGAGGGGYLLIFHSPKKRNQLVNALSKEGGEIMNFNFEFSGTKIWNVKNKI
ncbi:MAG: sugar phosphate nucleotidyltransferase [Candidatus Pacearchaeota archaeon]